MRSCGMKSRSAMRLGGARRQVAVAALAEPPPRSKAVSPDRLTVGRVIGEGALYEGSLLMPRGNLQTVLVKKLEPTTELEDVDSKERATLLLEAYAAKTAKAGCTEFVGYCDVAEGDAPNQLAAGLWVMWRFTGSRNLLYYLKKRDCMRLLVDDLNVAEENVLATVMKQLLESLQAFHTAGLVHRDVRPQNINFDKATQRFKLVDLGACADLRTGTDLVGTERDNTYDAPEEGSMPSDASYVKSMLKVAITPELLDQHRPDKLDAWLAGIVMLQLALPNLRTDRGLSGFCKMFGSKHGYDLDAWRAAAVYVPRREFEQLDADNGAGWDLVKMLLRPRGVVADDEGNVMFQDLEDPRISVSEALNHRFMKQAIEVGTVPKAKSISASSSPSKRTATSMSARIRGSSVFDVDDDLEGPMFQLSSSSTSLQYGQSVQVWSGLTASLASLENRIKKTSAKVQSLSQVTMKLKSKTDTGSTEAAEKLQEGEEALREASYKLFYLLEDYNRGARDALAIFGIQDMRDAATGQANRSSSERAVVSSLELRQAQRAMEKLQFQMVKVEKERVELSAGEVEFDEGEDEAGSSGRKLQEAAGSSGRKSGTGSINKFLGMFGLSQLSADDEGDEGEEGTVQEGSGSVKYRALSQRIQALMEREEEQISELLAESADLQGLITELQRDSEVDAGTLEASRSKMKAEMESQEQKIKALKKELKMAVTTSNQLEAKADSERAELARLLTAKDQEDASKIRALELNQKALMEVMELRGRVNDLEKEIASGAATPIPVSKEVLKKELVKEKVVVSGVQAGLSGWAVEEGVSRLQQLDKDESVRESGLWWWAVEQQKDLLRNVVGRGARSDADEDEEEDEEGGDGGGKSKKPASFWDFVKP